MLNAAETGMPDTLWWVAALFAVVGVVIMISALKALRHWRPVRMSLHLLWALMFFAVAGACGAVALGVQGYRALTHEDIAVMVRTEPLSSNRFKAQFRFPDGHDV